jgi:predicted SAM-dependent methyltransferase
VIRLGIRSTYRKLSRALRHPEKKFLRQYLGAPGTKKLHIGCGDHLIEGWLNCDLLDAWQIMRGVPIYPLDATKPFPFANDTFDTVFSEHMIEHVSYDEGSRMLAECHRVLKPGHFIRVTTPDLKFLVALYAAEKTEFQKQYIKWASDKFLDSRYPVDIFVINNFFRNWGHRFIYDEAALRRSMIDAGFVDVTSRPLGESPQSDLRNLENEGRMPPYFLRLESLVLEAMKPC